MHFPNSTQPHVTRKDIGFSCYQQLLDSLPFPDSTPSYREKLHPVIYVAINIKQVKTVINK